ncbi:MAG: hypothetical protein WKF96_09930 [Solirubrobacteraceae bacterium]
MTNSWDDQADEAGDALTRGDRDAASRAYERAAQAAEAASALLDAGALYAMAAMHAPTDPERRDGLRFCAQLVFQDASDFDRASEVALIRSADAEAAGNDLDARTLLGASIALAGAFLDRAAYGAIASPIDAIDLEETAVRVQVAARALHGQTDS